jgi:hypothetical protein
MSACLFGYAVFSGHHAGQAVLNAMAQ